ncbi:electron carrier [Spatholobus suberectus]|nr:electron carrier [Spatholobus suberectus]
MGCANSKPKGCQHCHCNTPYYSSLPRTFSVHVHHPPQSKGDSYHVVALTSTTLGSLDQVPHRNHGNGLRFPNGKVIDSDSLRSQNHDEEEEKEESEAKTWSDMIEQMLPKAILRTPISTPPCEPETINTWELMEGLEDTSPFRSPKHFKSFSFDVNVNRHDDPPNKPCGFIENGNDSMRSQMSEEGSNGSSLKAAVSDFDYPQEKQESMATKGFSIEEEKMISDDDVMDLKGAPCGKDKVVLYFTSLRGVRRTYEDCCHVRVILKGLGVRLDERDVSMHSGFKEELKELLGHGYGKGGLGLPRVFVGRNYIGGAEDIQQLHEDGKLEKLLQCCEKIDDTHDGVDGGGVCEACGDIRFVPCETCYGSCKIYYEGDGDDEEEEEEEDGENGFQRCPDCNENGLIRCPMCCC